MEYLKIGGYILLGVVLLSEVPLIVLKKLTKKSPLKMDDVLVRPLVKSMRMLAITVGVLYAASLFGLSFGPLWGLVGGVGLGLGIALKEGIFGDLAALLSLVLGRKFDIGDTIEVGGEKGRVVAVSLSCVTLESTSEEHIYIPLKKVNGSVIIKEIP